MKFIVAVIKPHRLDQVRKSLAAAGIEGMTVTEVRGHGRQKGHTEIYRGAEYEVHFLPKVRIEVAVTDELADRAVEAIAEAARTNEIGDGKVFMLPLEHAVRIRTGEAGEAAL